MNAVPLFVNGKAAYQVIGTRLRKSFANNHILLRPKGLAVDIAILDDAEALGVTLAEFTHRETRSVYRVPLAFLREHGVYLNRGYGPQKVLPLEYWSIDGAEPLQRPHAVLEAEKAEAERNTPRQISLFAEAGA